MYVCMYEHMYVDVRTRTLRTYTHTHRHTYVCEFSGWAVAAALINI